MIAGCVPRAARCYPPSCRPCRVVLDRRPFEVGFAGSPRRSGNSAGGRRPHRRMIRGLTADQDRRPADGCTRAHSGGAVLCAELVAGGVNGPAARAGAAGGGPGCAPGAATVVLMHDPFRRDVLELAAVAAPAGAGWGVDVRVHHGPTFMGIAPWRGLPRAGGFAGQWRDVEPRRRCGYPDLVKCPPVPDRPLRTAGYADRHLGGAPHPTGFPDSRGVARRRNGHPFDVASRSRRRAVGRCGGCDLGTARTARRRSRFAHSSDSGYGDVR